MVRTSNTVVSGGEAAASCVRRKRLISQHDALINSFIQHKVNAAVYATHGDAPPKSLLSLCLYLQRATSAAANVTTGESGFPLDPKPFQFTSRCSVYTRLIVSQLLLSWEVERPVRLISHTGWGAQTMKFQPLWA